MPRIRWVGTLNRDFRILCENTGKVYSCPESAAYDLRASVKRIVFVCDRWTKFVRDDIKVHWLDQFMAENPGSTLPKIKEIQYELVPRPTIPRNFNRRGQLKISARPFAVLLYTCIRTFMGESGEREITVNSSELCDIMVSISRRKRSAFHTTPSGVSRHILRHENLYRKVLGLEIGYEYSKRAKKDIRVFRFKTVDGADKLMSMAGYDYKVHSISTDFVPGSKPVMRMRDRFVFSSASMAYRMTGISTNLILYCCKGDIDYVEQSGVRDTFRFVKFV